MTITEEMLTRLQANPDAKAWAEEFCKSFVVFHYDGGPIANKGEDVMVEWFSKAFEITDRAGA